MFHLLHYSYSSKKANKIWNMEMIRLSSAINTFSAFDKKIIWVFISLKMEKIEKNKTTQNNIVF